MNSSLPSFAPSLWRRFIAWANQPDCSINGRAARAFTLGRKFTYLGIQMTVTRTLHHPREGGPLTGSFLAGRIHVEYVDAFGVIREHVFCGDQPLEIALAAVEESR